MLSGQNDVRLDLGVSLRHWTEHDSVAGKKMLVVSTVASAYGRDECAWSLSRDDESGYWYAAVTFRPGTSAETGADVTDVVLGPAETESKGLRLIADQLAAYLAGALRSKAWYEPDPELLDGGLSSHLLHSIRETRLLERLKAELDRADRAAPSDD